MTTEELHEAMQREFALVRAELAGVRTDTQTEFTSVRSEMAADFANVRAEMTAGFAKARDEMKAEAETTRRHFGIMVEKVSESVRIVAEGTAHNTSRLDDHQRRLRATESSRRR